MNCFHYLSSTSLGIIDGNQGEIQHIPAGNNETNILGYTEIITYSKIYSCSECNRNFASPRKLNYHMHRNQCVGLNQEAYYSDGSPNDFDSLRQ